MYNLLRRHLIIIETILYSLWAGSALLDVRNAVLPIQNPTQIMQILRKKSITVVLCKNCIFNELTTSF